jgi:hypothetical protein
LTSFAESALKADDISVPAAKISWRVRVKGGGRVKRCILLVLAFFALSSVSATAQNLPKPPPLPYFFGILRIQTVPAECTYSIDGVENYKGVDVVGIEELPVGTHTIVCELSGKRLSQEINLRRGEVIVVEADFTKMSIEWRYAALQGITIRATSTPPGSGYGFGAEVVKVNENSTFKGYDIRVGDIVVRIGGSTFTSLDEYLDRLFLIRPGDATAISFLRNGRLIEKEILHLPRSWENVRRFFDFDPSLFKNDR